MKKPSLKVHTSLATPSRTITKRTPRSAQLTSSLLKTPKNPVDLYLELTRNAQRRNYKLDRFFGPSELRPRIDACTIRQALDHGLAGCLSSKRVLSYFLSYLFEERIVEGLFFLLKVEQFENLPLTSFEERAEAAALIYETYIHPEGLLYVECITPTVRMITNDVLSRCTMEQSESLMVCFNAAKLQVWDVLELVFTHFKNENGTIHRQLNNNFDPDSIMWGPNNLDGIVKRILRFGSSDLGSLSDEGCPPISEEELQHLLPEHEREMIFEVRKGRLVRKITLSFIKECLDLDIAHLQAAVSRSTDECME